MGAQTLYDKLWASHVVRELPGGDCLIYIDRQLVHEVSSPQSFAALRAKRIGLRRPETHFAVADHAIPTDGVPGEIGDPQARAQVAELETNVQAFAIPYAAPGSREQGIVHVIGPESGFTLPGITLVCGDSHTSTHGAFGTLAFGIGASESGTVMATQCLRQTKARNMRVTFTGTLPAHVGAKDMALALLRAIGTGGAVGYAIEFAGETVRALDMAGRMTLCNMAIEAGSRTGLIAPDETTFAYLQGRPRAPEGADWQKALAYWRTLPSDRDARFDREVSIDVSALAPQVTWGTSPDQVIGIGEDLPLVADTGEAAERTSRALAYMALDGGAPLVGIQVTHVFIGSCTNSRIEDLRAAAEVVRGRKSHPAVKAIVVPGSGLTRQQAEAEGLDRIFRDAGLEWRNPGCSMCVAMNTDRLGPGDRCASTSNRNFEGRQGRGGRTHLMSPAMAAAAAVTGAITDVRALE
jgi:3-isopropylmalate/(R)-2-methylmalate dehydratase large subunit